MGRANKKVRGTWVMLAVLVAATTAWAWTEPSPLKARVIQATSDQVATFERDGERFKRTGLHVAGVALANAAVLDVSRKGYVQVQTAGGAVWVDKLKLRIEGDLSLAPGVRCAPSRTASGVTASRDAATAGVRGAGEGCP